MFPLLNLRAVKSYQEFVSRNRMWLYAFAIANRSFGGRFFVSVVSICSRHNETPRDLIRQHLWNSRDDIVPLVRLHQSEQRILFLFQFLLIRVVCSHLSASISSVSLIVASRFCAIAISLWTRNLRSFPYSSNEIISIVCLSSEILNLECSVSVCSGIHPLAKIHMNHSL